ncbi:MAG: Gfo/Idh/MocA family oxidoreductase [Thermoguttaceae bacterium]
MRLRVGLIGLGELWQPRHAPALRALADRFDVRAICDPVRHRAEQAAADFHADAVDGYHVLVEREDIDAVLVLSPQWFRELPILAACESGKAVYCAMGLELDPAEADAIKQRVEGSGIAFMAELPRRHAPATVRLKELIATQLGAPRLLFCHERTPLDQPLSGPACSPSLHPTFRNMVGQVDWCHYVAGTPPTSVIGVMHYAGKPGGTEDYRMMSLDFSPHGSPGTGATAQISCGRYVPASWHEAIGYRPMAALQVSCVRGIAFVDLPATLVWFDETGRHQESLESERPLGEQLLTQFFRSVTSLVRRTDDLDDACLALEIVQAARRSHEEGRRIGIGD